jgi:hypothetical protein
MGEEKQVGLVRRRRSGKEAERLVMEFEASGLTRGAFCREHGLSVATLDNYRKRLRTAMAATEHRVEEQGGVPQAIVPVELIDGARCANRPEREGMLYVELSCGRRIGIPTGFDATTLERLIAVLEGA